VVGDYNDDIFIHGYVLSNGNYSTLDFPGAVVTTPFVINNHGIIVGQYQNADASFHGFTYNGNFSTFDCPTGGAVAAGINDQGDKVEGCSNGSFEITAAGQITPISFPGASSTFVKSINNSGQIAGIYCTSSDNIFNPFPCHGFVLFNGNYQTVDFPGSMNTFAGSINNLGQIVGQYEDTSRQFHGFLATQAELVDPVPDLLSGPAVISLTSPVGAKTLASKGQAVQGVAADGVTQVVIRIPAVNVGDQFTVTILNDQDGKQINSPNEDGALGNPGDTSFSQPQVAVTAVATTSDTNNPNPMAFAVYRAPIDFARPTSGGGYKSGSCINSIPPGTEIFGGAATDDQSACRTVTISVQNQTAGTNFTIPAMILRPPVILIHGLWGSWRDWDNFKPLVSDANTVDSRFSVGRVNYDNNVSDLVGSTDPVFTASQLGKISSNSLGFAYNAKVVQPQIEQCIEEFRSGTRSKHCTNSLNVPVAAVEADIVGHSMGGLIARTIAGLDTFLSADTFGQGDIHKLITIDTPHLGTPVAIQLLSDGENGGRLQELLAFFRDFPLKHVNFNDGSPSASGAVADLEGDDTTSALSDALAALNSKASHLLPAALIAAVYQNFSTLDSSGHAIFIRAWCSKDRLAQQLTSSGWPAIFHGSANDAIVPEASQLAGLDPSVGFAFSGFMHSTGIEALGFAKPSVLDGGDIATEVILLLNQPWTTPRLYNLLTP
jgi:pimeloyl-ACP methyl ester carboxylesterase